MRISKATHKGCDWAIRRYAKTAKDIERAYNVWDGEQWLGVVVFCRTDPNPFDKWHGQVYEMVEAVSALEKGAAMAAIEALKREAPFADAVVSRDDPGGFVCIGKYGDGKGAYIVDGERLHRKTVKQRGWHDSVLWLRENVDPKATQFNRDATDLYYFPLTDEMTKRAKALEEVIT